MATKYISLEAAIDAVKGRFSMPVDYLIAEVMQKVPAADVVEVVRCKECVHDNSNDQICPIPWVKRMLDSYCSFGERRADNG